MSATGSRRRRLLVASGNEPSDSRTPGPGPAPSWTGSAGRADSDRRSSRDGRERDAEPSLSVVVPTLNEAERIGTCLDSVFRVCEDVPRFEVILVDSNSEDGTVDIAREYPVTILRLSPDEHVTPGAGRYVGTVAASGEHVLFVDGDMELADGWLARARRLLRDRESVAGVGGHLNATDADEIEAVKALHGVMLYDAGVLADAGSFDPHLQGYEDIELGFRIRSEGYELVELPTVVATHSRPHTVPELRRRWENGYMFGFGQVLRKSVRSPRDVGDLLLRKWLQVLFVCWVLLGIGLALVGPVSFLGWVVLSGVAFVADALYEGASPAAIRFLWQGVAWPGYLYGFVRSSRDPSEYPVETVSVVAAHENDGVRPDPAFDRA